MNASLLRILGFTALLAAGVSALAATDDPAGDLYKEAKASYEKLHSMPKEKRFRHHFQEAIDDFHKVEDRFPKSYVADDALYMMGRLYSEMYEISRWMSDLDKAAAAYKNCAARFPKSNYADDCLVLRAKTLLKLNKRDPAVAALKAVVSDYGDGDMRREAEQMLAREGIKVAAVAPSPTPTVVPAPQKKKTSGGEASAESQAVTSVKPWSNEQYTQIAIYGGGPMAWSIKELPADKDKNRRIYVDLKKAHIGEEMKAGKEQEGGSFSVKIDDGLLQGARIAQFDPETVRVVLDVASIEDYTVIPMEDPFRLLVQVFGKRNAAVAIAAATPAPGATPGTVISLPATPLPIATATPGDPAQIARELQEAEKKGGIPLFQQLGLKVGRIYVDAGHGGHDPGARGPSGLLEKDVALKLAKKVQLKLKDLGYDAILTRKDDTYLALEERSGIANEGRGDLFVSIHCNSTEGNTNASGVETYFAKTASDEAAKKLAAIENATTTQKMSEMDQILESLLRGAFTPMSADLASSVQSKLHKQVSKTNTSAKDYGVKSALFYVLLTAQMPAILVETSFISNAKDEKRLKDEKYLDGLAASIAEGVDSYLISRIPTRSLIAEPADAKSEKTPAPEKAEAGKEETAAEPKGKTKSGKGKSQSKSQPKADSSSVKSAAR